MATVTATVLLTADHAPTDVIELRVGSTHGLSLAGSTPAGGVLVAEEPIGPAADLVPPATRTISGSHRPPGGCAVLAVGVAVRDAAGNRSLAYETFDEVTDYPRGVATLPPEATGNANEALLSWTPSPDV